MNVRCRVCNAVHEVYMTLETLAKVRCPACGVSANLVQIPMGRTTNGVHDQPGMPRHAETILNGLSAEAIRAMSPEESVAATQEWRG